MKMASVHGIINERLLRLMAQLEDGNMIKRERFVL